MEKTAVMALHGGTLAAIGSGRVVLISGEEVLVYPECEVADMDRMAVSLLCAGLLLLGGNVFWVILLYHSRKEMQAMRELARQCHLDVSRLHRRLRQDVSSFAYH